MNKDQHANQQPQAIQTPGISLQPLITFTKPPANNLSEVLLFEASFIIEMGSLRLKHNGITIIVSSIHIPRPTCSESIPNPASINMHSIIHAAF